MNINIYEDYKIKVTGDYTYLSEENETIYDNIFVKDKIDKEIILNAGKSRKEIKAHQYYMLLCDIEKILNSSL